MVLEITNVAFEGLSWLHLDIKEMVAVLIKLLPRDVLVEEGIVNLFEASEGIVDTLKKTRF